MSMRIIPPAVEQRIGHAVSNNEVEDVLEIVEEFLCDELNPASIETLRTSYGRERGSTVERRPEVSPTARGILTEAAEERERVDAAREWLCERADGVPAIYWQQTPHWIRERVSELYPGNTPGQDGWTSFCEDWSAGTLAPARKADPLDAATGQGRR